MVLNSNRAAADGSEKLRKAIVKMCSHREICIMETKESQIIHKATTGNGFCGDQLINLFSLWEGLHRIRNIVNLCMVCSGLRLNTGLCTIEELCQSNY